MKKQEAKTPSTQTQAALPHALPKAAHVKLRLLAWGLGIFFTVFLVLAICAASALTWLARTHGSSNPLNLTQWLPKIETFLETRGLRVQVGEASMWYDGGVIIRAGGVFLSGADDELAVVVDQAAIKFSNRRLLALIPAPKVVEAQGVTLRLVRNKDNKLLLAGISLGRRVNEEDAVAVNSGVVEWLNGLIFNATWGSLKQIRVANLNLLLRDDVQGTEWVLEDGKVVVDRYADVGERGSIVGDIRRIYSEKQEKAIPQMPVLVTFEHARGADEMVVEARFEGADMALVSDYLPPRLQPMLRGSGQLAVGTSVGRYNTLSLPWVTVRLQDVILTLPEDYYSKPLEFADVLFSAQYAPSPADVLTVRQLAAETKQGLIFEASGTVVGTTTDNPTFDITASSARGEAQRIFDFFPDKLWTRAMPWLRENIRQADFTNLQASWRNRLKSMVNCDTQCGLDVTADLTRGTVNYADAFPVATLGGRAKFYLQGGKIQVLAEGGKSGTHDVDNVQVVIDGLFNPSPTVVSVSGEVQGEVEEVMTSLSKLIKKPLPLTLSGEHAGNLNIAVTLLKGKPVTINEISLTANTVIRNGVLSNLAMLRGESVDDISGSVAIKGGQVSFSGTGHAGTGGGTGAVAFKGSDTIVNFGQKLNLNLKGLVDAGWLWRSQGKPTAWEAGGTAVAEVNLQRQSKGWAFGWQANAARANLTVPALSWNKPIGSPLTTRGTGMAELDKNGQFTAARITELALQGNDAALKGSITYVPGNLAATTANLPTARLGQTDVSLKWENSNLSLTGKRLDLRGYTRNPSATMPLENFGIKANVNELLMKEATIRNVTLDLARAGTTWQFNRIAGDMGQGATVNIAQEDIAGGRKHLRLNITNLGRVLSALDYYERIKGGHLTGDITFDAPGVGGGIINVSQFELAKPPALMQLLGLISLEQLVAGTDSILFTQASLPVRLDGPWVYLDRASLEGPSMSLRLDGSYNRTEQQVNFDGSVAPAIPFNRLVTQIPLIGGLLSGSQDGVVVADFKMKGESSSPRITVSPLSVVTPGLLKDIFRGITGSGSTTKPNVQDGSRR